MTLATLLIHRIRQARSERRERAPEDIVHSLPTGVWTGEGVEFHSAEKEAGVIAHKRELAPTPVDPAPQQPENDATTQNDAPTPETTAETSSAAAAPLSSPSPSISHHVPVNGRGRKYLKKAWFAEQSECAICLSDFEKGDQLRILPCGHIFHQDEVDAWLIQRKKLVSTLVLLNNKFMSS
jgi:RING-like zinc finger